MAGILSILSTGIGWFAFTAPDMAVHATVTKIRSDMKIPPEDKRDIEERSLSQRLGSATKTAITVSS